MRTLIVTNYVHDPLLSLVKNMNEKGDEVVGILSCYPAQQNECCKVPTFNVDAREPSSLDQEIEDFISTFVSKWASGCHEQVTYKGYPFYKYVEIYLRSQFLEIVKMDHVLNEVIVRTNATKLVLFNLSKDIAEQIPLLSSLPIDSVSTIKPPMERAHIREFLLPFYLPLMGLYNRVSHFWNQKVLQKKTILMAGGIEKSGATYRELFRRRFHITTVNDLFPQWNKIFLRGAEILLRPPKSISAMPPCSPDIATFREKDYSQLFNSVLRMYSRVFAQYKRLVDDLEALGPLSFVFLTCDPLQHAALVQDFALRHKIPSAIFQHGVYGRAYTLKYYHSDYLFVWGSPAKTWLISHGMPDSKIRITGCPAFSSFHLAKGDKRPRGFYRSICLVALSWLQRERVVDTSYNLEMISRLKRVLSHFPNKEMVIKLHPRQDAYEIKQIEELVGGEDKIRIVKNQTLSKLLQQSCLCFTYASSVGLEAIMAGKLLIKTNFIFYANNTHPYQMGENVVCVQTEEEAKDTLDRLLTSPEEYQMALKRQATFYEQYVSMAGPDAAEALANEIAHLAQ